VTSPEPAKTKPASTKPAKTKATTEAEKIDPAVLRIGLILVVGAIAVVFDTTIVSVALHTLAVDLHASVSAIQWVTTGYLLALGMAVPLSTWALARFGGKRLWLFALALFGVGSVGSSLAWNVGSLVAWRLVQGVGGGLLLPVMMTLIIQAAGGKVLGRTVTVAAMPALLGPILGPLAGGAILTHLSWRFMFWVNVPFCVAGLIMAARYLPADRPSGARPKLDATGFALLAPGIAALILGLSNAGRAAGFAHPDVLIPLLIGVALVAGFGGYATRRAAPLVDLRLFAHRSVASSSAVLFFSGFALFGAMLLLPMFYQQARGYSALTAGIMLIPQGVGTMASRTVAGALTDKGYARPLAVLGFLIVAASTVPFAFVTAGTSTWLLSGWLLIRGFGLGLVTLPVMAVAYLGLDKAQVAHASVLSRTVQQVGGSFGTAVLAVILERAVAAHPGDLVAAFNVAFWWSVAFSVLAAALALWLPGRASAGPPSS